MHSGLTRRPQSSERQEYVSDCCCGSSVPASCQAQTDAYTKPSDVQVTGDQPVCNICLEDDQVPLIPAGFVVIRYVGSFSCLDLYYHGLEGKIDDYMCGPVQDYVYDVCGCGGQTGSVKRSSGGDEDSTESSPSSSSGGLPFDGPNDNVDGPFILFVGVLSLFLLVFIVMMIRRRHCRSSRRRYVVGGEDYY